MRGRGAAAAEEFRPLKRTLPRVMRGVEAEDFWRLSGGHCVYERVED
jgi:hypothetical protein